MMLVRKPACVVIDDKLAVYMGGDYKMMSLDVADAFVRKLQGELAKLRRQEKRKARQARKEA